MRTLQYCTAYIAAMGTLAILDTAYFMLGGLTRYQRNLGDLLQDPIRLAPAIPLYLISIAGYVYFAIRPAIESNSAALSVLNCMFLGFLYFSFYELTNLSTIRDWPVLFSLSEIVWGVFASSIIGAVSFYAARHFS